MLNVLVKEPKHRHNNYPYSWNIENVTNENGTLVFHAENQKEPWRVYRKSFQPFFFVKEDLSLWAEVRGHVNLFNEQEGFTNKRDFKIEKMVCPVKIVDDEFRVSLFDDALTYRQKAKEVPCRSEKDAHLIANAACQILADSAPPLLEPFVDTDGIHPVAIVKSHEAVVEPFQGGNKRSDISGDLKVVPKTA